jgi:hypothetical protein
MKATRNSLIWLAVMGCALCASTTIFAQQQAPAGHVSKDASNELSGKDLEACRTKLRALKTDIPQAWRVRFVKPATVPAPTKIALGNLSKSLIDCLESNASNDADAANKFEAWSSTYSEVFTLRIMLEWQNFETSWREFQVVQDLIARNSNKTPREHRAKAIADMANPILRLWIASNAAEVTPWIGKFETEWLMDGQGNLPAWWLRDRCDYGLALIANESTPESQNMAKKWTLAYLADQAIPLKRRAYVLTRYTLQMHTLGKADDAAAVLKWWEEKHPEACIDDIRFLHASFFVYQIGQGNREEARKVLERLDGMVRSGALSPEDDRFRIITQNYYQNLRSSDLEHSMMTSKLLDARSSQATEQP